MGVNNEMSQAHEDFMVKYMCTDASTEFNVFLFQNACSSNSAINYVSIFLYPEAHTHDAAWLPENSHNDTAEQTHFWHIETRKHKRI